MDSTQRKFSDAGLDSFVVTHCQNCAAGWTRVSLSGMAKTVCLLDREAVLTGMSSCDRFEVRKLD